MHHFQSMILLHIYKFTDVRMLHIEQLLGSLFSSSSCIQRSPMLSKLQPVRLITKLKLIRTFWSPITNQIDIYIILFWMLFFFYFGRYLEKCKWIKHWFNQWLLTAIWISSITFMERWNSQTTCECWVPKLISRNFCIFCLNTPS